MNDFIASRYEIEKANRERLLKWEKIIEFRDLTEAENEEYEKIKNSYSAKISIMGGSFRYSEELLHAVESDLAHHGFIMVGEVNPMPSLPLQECFRSGLPEVHKIKMASMVPEFHLEPNVKQKHKGHERPYKFHR
jgi:hypothetical protein